MTKFILSGGYYHKTPDGGQSLCDEMVKDISARPVKILDCLFGRSVDTWQKKISDDAEFFAKFLDSFTLVCATQADFIKQIAECDIVFFQGSRPEDTMNILETIPDWHNAIAGKTVVASSAGASMVAQYFGVGKSTSGKPRLGTGLGLLPIKLIPHWKSDHGIGFVADWDSLYRDLDSYNEPLEMIVLRDGELWVCVK